MPKKKEKPLTAQETLDLINKQWATNQDIQKLAYVGYSKARVIKKEIENELVEKGYRISHGLVPMDKVVEYLKINVNYLKRIAKKN